MGSTSTTTQLPARTWERLPAPPLALAALLFGLAWLPRISSNPRLFWSVSGAGALLVAWAGLLWIRARATGALFRTECAPLLRQHYIQASVQTCVYLYWGWYWPNVYAEAPLFLC